MTNDTTPKPGQHASTMTDAEFQQAIRDIENRGRRQREDNQFAQLVAELNRPRKRR